MYPECGFSAKEVAETVAWNFHGGTLGSYEMKTPTASSETTYPNGPLSSLISEDGETSWSLANVLLVRKRYMPMRGRVRRELATTFWAAKTMHQNTSKLIRTGLCATYALIRMLLANSSGYDVHGSWHKMEAYALECISASSEASNMDVESVKAATTATLQACRNVNLPSIEQARQGLESVVRELDSRLIKRKARRAAGVIMDHNRIMDAELNLTSVAHTVPIADTFVKVCLNTVLFRYMGHLHVMGPSDVKRAYQFMRGYSSGLFATIAQVACGTLLMRSHALEAGQSYVKQVSRILEATSRVTPQNEVLVCKVFKRAHGAFLGEIAGPLCAEETKGLWEEVHSTPECPKDLVNDYVAEMRSWDIPTALNLGKAYKLCCSADVCMGSALIERHKQVTNSNVMSEVWQDMFLFEHRSQMLRAYIRAPDVSLRVRQGIVAPVWYGAYRLKQFEKVPSDEIHTYLDWEGTAVMPLRSPLDPSVWKDSGLGWDNWDIAVDPGHDRRLRNMIVRMLFDNDCPMPGVRHMASEHFHLEDEKPEGHKGDASVNDVVDGAARGIYSGNACDRMDQSWMEEAVYNVTKHHPAFMIGAGIASRDAKVSTVLSRNKSLDTVDVYYSFDIKGWSPLMPMHAQRISHANWAELYDEVLFRNAHHINEGATVYNIKEGYSGWFVNPSANFEGYNAKEMTYILITLMSLSVKEWRSEAVRLGYLTDVEAERISVVLLGYIDDGMAKATLPRLKAELLFDLWKSCTKRVFDGCGYTLEINKCYPSDRFGIFLNEVYYKGRHVAHGTRAAMTMCSENISSKVGMLAQLTAIATGARGAVTAGLDAVPAALLMYYHTWAKMRTFVYHPDPVAAAIWSHTPTDWGGIGMPSMLQLSTSGGGASTEESAYVLQTWAHHNQAALNLYRSVISLGYVDRSARALVTSPLGGHVAFKRMSMDYTSGLVREALERYKKRGELSNLALTFMELGNDMEFGEFCEACLAGCGVIQEQVLRDLYAAHPHGVFSAFASRVEKATTLRGLVGGKRFSEVERTAIVDVRFAYDHVRKMMSMGV